MSKKRPLVIEYTDLLHKKGGPDSDIAKKFREDHREDGIFQKCANTIDKAFRIKFGKGK